ncbi:hypothetical protein [Methanogenium cariaci]|uniref:hypothetical protein n=1 Tax=Methanogenium cariaci TaxID=2197 RepID=UPI00155DA6A0|nr:hypothetical protein [Methanogenium cariaci]
MNNGTGNYSEIGMIPEIGTGGDMIHVWGGIPGGHTYEGGFSITAADVTIQRWEGSPVQPVLTSPVNTTLRLRSPGGIMQRSPD